MIVLTTIPKGTAFVVPHFPLVEIATGLPKTSATSPDSEISKDAGAFTDCDNEATEDASTGYYDLSLTATEMNASYITVQVKSSGCYTQTIIIITDVTRGRILQYATATVTASPAPSTTTANLSLVTGDIDLIAVGDLMWWTDDSDLLGVPAVTIVTSYSSNNVVWSQALGQAPSTGHTIIFSRSPINRLLHNYPIQASPVAGSPNERIKSIDDDLPNGDIDNTTAGVPQ